MAGSYTYDTKVFSPIVGGEAVRVGKIRVILPYSAPGLDAADLTFKANLVNSGTGQNVAVPLELLEAATRETLNAQTLEIALADVPEGKYFLSSTSATRLPDRYQVSAFY